MSRKIHVAIIEPSEILRAGIIDVLKRINAPDIYVTEVSDMNQFECHLFKHTPELLIINPVSSDPGIIKESVPLPGITGSKPSPCFTHWQTATSLSITMPRFPYTILPKISGILL